MTSKTFVSGTVIDSAWLNDVNDSTYTADTAPVGSFRASLESSSGSSLVGYLPAGTGAVATDVQSKLRESVSVLDFGAVGDGVADDTAAFQAAFNTAVNNEKSKAIHIPGGKYVISSTITVTEPNVVGSITLYGDSAMKSNILFTGSGSLFNFVYGENTAQQGSVLHISKLSLVTNSITATSAIKVSRVASAVVLPSAVFEDLYVYQESGGRWVYGVHTVDASDQWFNRCYFMHFGTATTAGLFVDNNLTGQSVYGLYLNGCSFNGGTNCVKTTGQLESAYFTDSSFVGAVTCLSMEAAGTTSGNPHLTIKGCHINGKTTSIYTNFWRAILITGADVYSGVGSGDTNGENLYIKSASSVSISGCKIEIGAPAYARSFIQLVDVADFSISGNVMLNASVAGIIITGTSTRGVISGNVIRGFNDGTVNAEGIYNAATGDHFVYSGNILNYFVKGIEFNSSNNLVTGNLFSNLTTGVSAIGGANNIAINNSFATVTTAFSGTLRRDFVATATVDPASIPTGTRATQLVPITGAALGDFVDFSAPYDVQDLAITANVQSANFVALYFKNDTGATKDLPSGSWKFRIHS